MGVKERNGRGKRVERETTGFCMGQEIRTGDQQGVGLVISGGRPASTEYQWRASGLSKIYSAAVDSAGRLVEPIPSFVAVFMFTAVVVLRVRCDDANIESCIDS